MSLLKRGIVLLDVHGHFLPGIDDGASDVAESLSILSESYKQGVRICVATPHCIIHGEEDIENFLRIRAESFEKLKAVLNGKPYPEIILGSEVFFDNNLSQYKNIEKLCFEGTNLMLAERGIDETAKKFAEYVYSVSSLGIIPIIAHIDRYNDWQKMIDELKNVDLIYQINADMTNTISGRHFIKKVMDYGNKFIIASDMHNIKKRKTHMAKAKAFCDKLEEKLIYDDLSELI